MPLHILLYTLPGIPSVYYGSEFGVEGRKESGSDDSLRPALNLADYQNALRENPYTRLIAALGRLRQSVPALWAGDYRELQLTTRQYAFCRELEGMRVFVTVNNDSNPAELRVPAGDGSSYVGALSGRRAEAVEGCFRFPVAGNSGEVWLPEGMYDPAAKPVLPEILQAPIQDRAGQDTPKGERKAPASEPVSKAESAGPATPPAGKPYEEMTVEELQGAILEKMAKNGPVTDRMRRDVTDNVWRDSLLNWVKSFR